MKILIFSLILFKIFSNFIQTNKNVKNKKERKKETNKKTHEITCFCMLFFNNVIIVEYKCMFFV